ncbi:Holliday junction branch migration complex subunit RuvA [Gammaproteobacteria bacterium]
MIGRLSGVLAIKQPPALLIDVQGVGYELEAPLNTFELLPEVGAQVTLYTHLVVREDAHLLYGFFTSRERSLFRDLLRVNGVGPRLALTILSGMDADALVRCINERDATTLTRLPGIGKKTAERLLIEMRDRIGTWQVSSASGTLLPTKIRDPIDDAISALINLGYHPPEASHLARAAWGEGLSTEEIIRRALRSTLRMGEI